MKSETITEKDDLEIRRLVLLPNESTTWHRDTCSRFTVVVKGSKLTIEYRASGKLEEVDVYPGLAGWEDPEPLIHRATNTADDIYEEVTTFYKPAPETTPQPEAD